LLPPPDRQEAPPGRLPTADCPDRPHQNGGVSVSTPVLFSESYYQRVLAEFGYTPFDLQRFDFTLAGMDADTLNTRYLCHHHAVQYLRTAPERRIVTTGFGMSGPPHLATVTHILKMIEFQRSGERCQIVL